MTADNYHAAPDCPTCGTAQTWRRKERKPEYRCGNGHEFDAPRDVDWESLKRCMKHKDELWEPYRVGIEIEGFGGLNVEVGSKQMQDFVDRFMEVSRVQAE